MNPNAVQGLRALLNHLNQPNVSREVDRLFRASTPSTASGNPSTPSVTTTAATGSTLQTPPSIRNIGPLFSARGGASRGRGRNRSRPYTSVGAQFSRVVILLGDPTEDDVPRGRARGTIRDAQREARVAFRTGMTSQEVRTTILYAFQAQGHLRTVT